MDTSEQYIKMCRRANKLQQEKYKAGYLPGDYILYEDDIPILIGFDILGVERFTHSGRSSIRLRVLEPPPVFNFNMEADYPVTIRVAELTVKVLCHYGIPIWLPRQDQLQGMVGRDWRYIFPKFIWWYTDVDMRHLEIISSMEQLWLAFVMKEKFGKTWNGEEWINE